MIVLKTSRAPHGQMPKSSAGSGSVKESWKGSYGKEETIRLMESYVRAWEAADAANMKHALPGIERMIIDIFVESGAQLNDEAKDLVRYASSKQTSA